jgi:hypothetical protein
MKLPAFEIDRLPYPNDPSRPPRTGVDRAQAAQLCEAAGKRLCSELEWERACAGSDGALYVTGDALDTTKCLADPASCAGPEGVHLLGVGLREWTADPVEEGVGSEARSAVARGAASQAPPSEHRCAARIALAPDSRAADLGFRCCRGTEQSPAYPTPASGKATEDAEIDLEALRAALTAVPELAPHASSFAPFGARDADAALRRGGRSRGGIAFWDFLSSVSRWRPVDGEELIVVAGHTEKGALIAVFHELADGGLAHAASTVIEEEDTSIAVGFNADHRGQLYWTTCYECDGEDGIIVLDEQGQVRFGFR